ncbi:MAG: hypothetical protein LLG13_15630 [Bacteroidales bacterium]|nr:hypothetical protein [Bacteroidales bacterium]
MCKDTKKRTSEVKNPFILATLILIFSSSCSGFDKIPGNFGKEDGHKRIVNIINFIRLCEPRDERITETVLFETVVNQVQLMEKYKLGGTFLLQYDALLDHRYQQLMKSLPDSTFEVGAWWEIPQPLVENAGLKWRGRFPWDWHADVGFATGYSPKEREKLVDVYMNDFKQIFGRYPKSVGSWFIDAHTLNYMYRKYGIVASCNCKDQIGTDGYTLWGGYWNQAYYPSVKNAYMPAQNEANQIPVPIFRMLGSDPVHQYDNGLGTESQGVVTLEPVYKGGGGDSTWVNWYFKEFVSGKCMEYSYVQVGQENSFTWEKMAEGFNIQLPLIAKLRDQKKIVVETLTESGNWFHEHYKTTPSTAVTVDEDSNGNNYKTVWFNSRFYRINLLWEDGTLRFRDIHLFDENLPSDYLTEKGTSSKCAFFTLPFVDGYTWSSSDIIAGLRFNAIVDGREISLKGGDPVIKDTIPGRLHISWPLNSISGTLIININELGMDIKMESKNPIKWFLDLTCAENANLPFKKISPSTIDSEFKGVIYSVTAIRGSFSEPGNGITFRIKPVKNTLVLNLSRRNQESNN